MLKSALLNKTTGKKVKPEDKFGTNAKFYSRIDGTELKQMKIGNEWFFVALDYEQPNTIKVKEPEKPSLPPAPPTKMGDIKVEDVKEPEPEKPKKEEVPPTHAKTPPPATP